jgi:hypothetical protein
MKRRNFFKIGTRAATMGVVGAGLGLSPDAIRVRAKNAFCPRYDPPAILTTYKTEDHRARLENIDFAEARISTAVRKHLVTSYIPGHAVYKPSGKSWDPTEQDNEAMAKLSELGIGIIQPWSDWSTPWGKNYLVATDPEGFKRMVRLAHTHGLKVIPYTSSQFFERTDKNFKKDWAWDKSFDLVEFDYHLAHCSPASPDWRAYILHRHLRVMDEYEVDGLYNDLGYYRPGERENFYMDAAKQKFAEDDVLAFKEGPKQDGAMADVLALLYAEIKRRGGIYKLHKEGVDTIYTDLKVYDYLWVGESNHDFNFVRESTKNFTPYVTPQRLVSVTPGEENETFINAIPYMQFPLIGHGQPGDQGDKYIETFAFWFKRYLPMVEEGSWVWIDILSSNLFESDLPKKAVASLFVNREVYLVVANYNQGPIEIKTTDQYVSVLGSTGQPQNIWKLDERSAQILKLVRPATDL